MIWFILFVSFPVSLFFWYICTSLTAFLQGTSFTRNIVENFKCISPKYRKNFIKNIVDRHEEGSIGGYWYKDIRDNDLYQKVADKSLPGLNNFIAENIVVPGVPFVILTTVGYFLIGK